jgi:hypothetical protein
MTQIEKQVFCLLMNETLFSRLDKAKAFLECDSVNQTIPKIISSMRLFLREKHLKEPAQLVYERINWNYKINVFMEVEDYNHVKTLHKSLNSYSMGGLVRKVLEEFLWFFELYGEDVYKKLNEHFAEFKKEMQEKKIWYKKAKPIELHSRFEYFINIDEIYDVFYIQIE